MSWPGEQVGELRLPAGLSGPLVMEARQSVPHEACGLIVGRREANRVWVTRTVSCENTAPPRTRETRFEIDPRRVIEEERSLRNSEEEVVGFYHSHPASDPVPSVVDRSYMALWPDAIWVIVGVEVEMAGGAVRAWSLDPADGKSAREVRVVSADGEGEEPN